MSDDKKDLAEQFGLNDPGLLEEVSENLGIGSFEDDPIQAVTDAIDEAVGADRNVILEDDESGKPDVSALHKNSELMKSVRKGLDQANRARIYNLSNLIGGDFIP